MAYTKTYKDICIMNMQMYIVVSLDYSMKCEEDEYPVSNSFVAVHIITESKEKAQEVCDKLNEEYSAFNLIDPGRHYKVVKMANISPEAVGTPQTCLWLRTIHDTLACM